MILPGGKLGVATWPLLAALFFLLTGPLPAQDDDAYHQALLNYKAGHYPAARLAIDDAEKAKPNDLAISVLKARILIEQHEFADGEALLHRFLTPDGPVDVQIALGDLYLRKRDFGAAANMYDQALNLKPNDPDITLRLIYSRINAGDLVTAGKYASELKPLDPVNPAYYFAHAALAEATGKGSEAEEDIQTVRTIYGITVTNRYLKTYLEVTSTGSKTGVAARMAPASTNSAPSSTNSTPNPAQP